MKLRQLRLVALSSLVVLASAPAALALDPNDLATKLIAAYAIPSTLKVSLGTATVTGNDVSFDGATITGKDGTKQVPVKLQLTNVAETADGAYTADSLKFPDVNYAEGGNGLVIQNIVFKQIYIPATTTETAALASARIFASASAGPISVTADGVKVLSIDSVSVNNSFKPSQAAPDLAEVGSVASTAGLKLDLTGTKDQEAAAQIKMLGLETVTGKIFESATWSLKEGHLDLAEISADADNVGKFKFSIDMTGYTPAFIQSLSELASSETDGDANAPAAATAKLLQAAQNLFLNSASIRFDDASITNRLVDMMSAGAPRQAFVEGIVAGIAQQDSSDASVPPEMVKTMQAAVRAYLTDPHSIEVRLAPKTPLGVLGLTAAMMAPASLADQIGLQVVVNDKPITEADAAKESGPVAAPAAAGGDNTAAPTDQNDENATSADQDGQNATDGSDSGDNSSAGDGSGEQPDGNAGVNAGTSGHQTTHN